MKIKFPLIILPLLAALSCSSKKDAPAFYDMEDAPSDSAVVDTAAGSDQANNNSNLVVVPFREEHGVKYVKVSVNGFSLEMIFDTGCSGSLISVAEANYFYQKGYLKKEDYIGNARSQIADGSIVDNMVFNLKEIIIDDKIHCENVVVTVSANTNAPLLLGNEVLNRLAYYTIDNEQKTITFKLKQHEY